jgi:hypothetical protein
MEQARIGISESDCDYSRLVYGFGTSSSSSSTSAEASGGGGSDEQQQAPSKSGVDAASDKDVNTPICSSNQCRLSFGITMATIFLVFFLFARRYVNRRDDSDMDMGASEFEMKMSSRSLSSYSDNPDYRDGHESGDRHRNGDIISSRARSQGAWIHTSRATTLVVARILTAGIRHEMREVRSDHWRVNAP